MSGAVALQVNGERRAVPATATVADLVREVVDDDAARAVAVARNGEIVPRAEWASTALAEGDAIEVVRPVQGG
ncbi:MAG: sulfur carrier protein ThiS [Dehalococcoidia bacterium]